MRDIYAYWRAACAPGTPEDQLKALALPTIGHGGGEDPQCGLWKVRLIKSAPPELMQVWLVHADGTVADKWTSNLTLAGTIGPLKAGQRQIEDRWLYAKPVTKDEAAHWRQHGHWPADPPPLPPRTHNLPSDPFEALKVEVEDRIEQARQWLTVNAPVDDQLGCDTATNYNRELLALVKRADTMHQVEKAPVLEQAREVDGKFRFREAVKALADALRDAAGSWMAREERRKTEEARRQYETDRAAAEAERQRLEAERQAKVRDDPVAALTEPEPEMPELPPPPAPVKVQAGGGVGARRGLTDDWDFEFVDYKLAALQVIEDPGVSIEVGKAIKRRVKAAKGKLDFPGIKIISRRKVA